MPYFSPAIAHPDLTAHDTLGLTTQAELDAHAATSHGALGSAAPLALGTAAAGVAASASREDHVHPTTGLARLGAANAFTVGGHTITSPTRGALTFTTNASSAWDGTPVLDIPKPATVATLWSPIRASSSFRVEGDPSGNMTLVINGGGGAAIDMVDGLLWAGLQIGDTRLVVSPRNSTGRGQVIRGMAGQTGDLFQAQDVNANVLTTISENGYFTTRKTVVPPDAELAAGEVALWFDATNGAANAKLMVKGKQNDGTVVTGSVPLT